MAIEEILDGLREAEESYQSHLEVKQTENRVGVIKIAHALRAAIDIILKTKVKNLSSNNDVSGSLPTFEETFKKQLYAAGDTQDFKRSGYITVNELWLRNFHKIAQGNDRQLPDQRNPINKKGAPTTDAPLT